MCVLQVRLMSLWVVGGGGSGLGEEIVLFSQNMLSNLLIHWTTLNKEFNASDIFYV